MTRTQNPKFSFKILKKDKKSRARVGIITTAHGIINTPAFVAVGTQGTVKGLSPKDLQEAGVQILFGNTYHLHLRPG
ncbi:MAG: tgt, partial [Candidatus Levybacteria bacterium]|nr:tgt [Candidatus Levybacteria bacterium]